MSSSSKRGILPALLLAAMAMLLVLTSTASAAVSQKQAAARAIDALGVEDRDDAVIVFGLTKPVRAGTKITQAGTTKPAKGSSKGLTSKLRSAGVRTIRPPRVLTASGRSWFFYEDRGPFMLYQHPGRVALVDVATGTVRVSRTIMWPPLINGRLPAFLKRANAYRSSKYQVFYQPWSVPSGTVQPQIAQRNLFDQDPFGPGRPLPEMTNGKAVADLLAAERSCVLRVTDTLPSFWNVNDLNLTRSFVGTLFEALERQNPGFIDDRYGARSGESLGEAVDRLVAAGCKDILLYIAGQGYDQGGEPVIHLGTSIRPGGLLAQQNLSATDLRTLMSARPGVTFKLKFDAPFSGGMIEKLRDLRNVLLIETPAANGVEAFAFIPEVSMGGQVVNSDTNPGGMLEFTNCELIGLKAFFSSAEEIDKAHQGQNEGVSFLAEMLARSQELCKGVGWADEVGSLPQLYAQQRASGNSTNNPPKADPQEVATPEDTPKDITLTGSDPDGDPITFEITKQPDHGSLSGTPPNVTYTPDADYVGKDDFSFKTKDPDGAESNTAKVDITVGPTNDSPVVTTSAGNTPYTEQDPATVIDGSLTVTDPDDTNLEGATVEIASNLETGDELVFTDQNGITGTYNSGTGVLTLTGTSTVANYQTALRSVGYRNLADDTPSATKLIEFTATDGDTFSGIATKTIAITPVNDNPVLDTTDADLSYNENSGPQPVDNGIAVTDPDSANLVGATVSISSNFVSAQDELAFTNQNGISGSYNDSTGVLTLTGSSSVANYQAALRSITYENSSDNPDPGSRTVSFQVDDGAASNNLSNTATRDINISESNDAPVVTNSAGATSYTEGDPATTIDGSLTVSDVDDTNIESAVVSITGNFESGDELVFVNTPSISGTYNSGTGVLTLTGTASVSDYQAALRSVGYRNTTDDNMASPKTVSFTVNDGDVNSAASTKNISITPVNDNPVLDTTDAALSYTEGDGPVAADSGITVTDPDSANLAGATIQITSNFSSADDELAFSDQNGITGSYNDSTGTLTLSGSASLADYQTALRSVTYENVSENPSGSKTVSFQVNDGGAVDNLSNTATRDINLSGTNDAPVVTNSAGATSYTEGDSGEVVDGSLTVSDADDTSLESAVVSITGNFESGDTLVFVDQNGITGTYNSGTGVLTLTGTASVSDYQAALRSVEYRNTSDDDLASPKTVSFTVNDGDTGSAASTKNISITPVNDAPVLDTSDTALSYTEDSGPAAIDSGITLTDPDSTQMQGATVQITTGFDSAADELGFTDQNGITGAYNDSTGTMTLSGNASVADYQTALRSVTYSGTESGITKTVSFQATDAEGAASNVATRDINTTASNDAPVVTNSAGATSYTEGDPVTTIDGSLTVSDADDTNLESAQVRISANFESGDTLSFANTPNITGNYNSGTGVLTLTGTDTVANYQAALRSVGYSHTGDNPATSKTVEFKVNDGDLDSAPSTKNIAVTPVNDAPVLDTTNSSLSYAEGDGAVDVDNGITLTDPDSTQMQGATVQITSNHVQAEDDLVFVNQLGITGNYNDSTGTMTLSGTASVADYQTALRDVRYQNTSDNPSTATRTVSFQATDAEGAASNVATRDINLSGANDAPVVDNSAGATSYTEGGGPVAVDNAVTVSDADDANLESAQVRISTGFESGDTLAFSNTPNITGNYNSGTGVLTLTGTDTKANYESALRSITYDHTGDNPSGGKTVEFKVNDGDTDSAPDTKSLNITGVNDGPVLTTSATTLSYTEGDGAVAVDPGLTLDDPENHNITGATVQITGNHVQAEDDLAFVNTPNITGNYNDSNGTLTLSGTDTEANYQAALRSVTYENSSDNPSTSTRTVTFQTTGDTGSPSQASNTATRDISVAQANDAPVVNTSAGSTPYTEGGSAATIDNAVTVTDADDANIESAQVRISSGFQSGDTLAFSNTPNITGNYNSGTGVLTLTGTDTKANYESALRSITFSTTNDAPVTSKTIEFKVNDGDVDSNAATKEVTVTPTNDAPTVTTSAGSASFVEDTSGPVEVDPNLTLTDPDSANMQSATVSITTNFDSSEDELQFTNTANITGNYNSGTGVLTLTGTDTVANYQAALRSVEYNNTDTIAPNTATRTVSFQATDSSSAASNTATRDVTVGSVNDAPVVDTTDTALAYTEDDPATVVDPNVSVTDQDDTNLEGAVVRISSGFQSGDELAFANTANITGNYNSGTGVLTLTGTDTVANYESALRSITYRHVGDSPNTSKTVGFKVNDGDVDSAEAFRDINVTPTNDAPIVDATNTNLTYTENDPATFVDTGLTIDDLENDNLSGGSASITANYQAGQDFLNWTDNNLADNITLDNINSSQQTIVLTGVDTEANYQAALRNVTYQNGSENPSTLTRTVTFSATDQPGLTGSDTRGIAITAVDDPPDAVNDSATVLEDAAATSIPVLTNDTDIDGGPKTISSNTDPANGTVVLTGGSPGAHTGLTYQPDPNYCNDPPGTTPDTFQYTVNGGDSAFVSMTVTCVNDAPVADDETFNGANSAVGNTTFQVNDPDDAQAAPPDPTDTGGVDDRPHKQITGDILAGDTDIDGPGPLTVTPGTFSTNDGGSVTIESDGDFRFEPSPGVSCTDTSDFFDYTVEDSGSPEQTDTGRVTIAITDCVWYVNNHDAQGNSGSAAAPFDTIQQAETASGNNHYVFVHDGNDTTLGHTTGLNMNSGERLIGHAEDLVVAGVTLQQGNDAERPQLTDTLEDVVALDDGNTVEGIEVDPTGAFNGIAGASGDTGGGTIDDVRIIDTGVAATDAGLELDSTTGTFNISNLTVNNTGAAGQNGQSMGVQLNNAGTVNFASTGTISITNTGAAGLDVTTTNMGAGSVFDDITVSSSITGGVRLSSASGTTTFGDGVGTDLSLTTSSGPTPAFGVANSGTVTVDDDGADTTDDNLHATGGPAVDVTGTSGPTLEFDDVDSTNSANDGINLDGLGTGTFIARQGDIGGAAGISFDLNGGSGAITYPGNLNNGGGTTAIRVNGRAGNVVTLSGPLSDTNDAGGGISLSSNTGGSTTISNGTKQLNTGATDAVDFQSSDGHTLNLTGGGLDIDTTSGRGIDAETSGTIQVGTGGSANTIQTDTGRGVNVANTDIAAGDMTFESVRVNSDLAGSGPDFGIRLDTVGSAGNLAVTGTGGDCTSTASCTGGVIHNTTSDGVRLTSAAGTSLTDMYIGDVDGTGIHAPSGTSNNSFNDLHLHNNGDAVGAPGTPDAGIAFGSMTGTNTITGSDATNGATTVQQSRNNQVEWAQGTGTGTLNVTNTDVLNGGQGVGTGANGISVIASTGGTAHTNVGAGGAGTGDVDITNNPADALLAQANNTSTATTDVDNVNFSTGNRAINFSGAGTAVWRINNSDFNGFNTATASAASTISINPIESGQIDGTITANRIGTAGQNGSGAGRNFGIVLGIEDGSDADIDVSSNNITETAQEGIFLYARDFLLAGGSVSNVNMTLRNNVVSSIENLPSPDTFTNLNGIEVEAAFDSNLCLDIAGNDSASIGSSATTGTELRTRQLDDSIFRLERLGANQTTEPPVETFLNTQNPLIPTAEIDANIELDGGPGLQGYTAVADGTCSSPSLP